MSKPSYYLGLDLGQASDYTALALIQPIGEGERISYHARHLQRWELGTSYVQIVAEVVELLNRTPVGADCDEHNHLFRPHKVLAVDGTGCGAPVVDLFRREEERGRLAAELAPVLITAGHDEAYENRTYRVPKRVLASTVQVALQNKRLKIAKELPEAAILKTELQNFRVKISALGHDSYEAWREGQHDDLVLAVALALWAATAERFRPVSQEQMAQIQRMFLGRPWTLGG